jgi:RHS repeat-associated protein
VLNRTDKITVTTASGQYINYTYDGNGSLIRKQAYVSGAIQTTTDYIDGFVYINNVLSYFPMPEGRVLNNAGTLKQEYILSDQQGNARISFQDNGTGNPVVTQENSYYAFGLIMQNSPVGTPAVPNRQLYNGGSEWQNDYSNLPDYYQTYNRNYDAAIARFVGVDPAAESAESMTSYQYAGNNPVVFNDPLGDKANINLNPNGVMTGGSGESQFEQGIDAINAQNNIYDDAAGLVQVGASGFSNVGYNYYTKGINNESLLTSIGVGSNYGKIAANAASAALNLGGIGAIGNNTIMLPEVNINSFRTGDLPDWWGNSQLFLNPSNYSYSGQTQIGETNNLDKIVTTVGTAADVHNATTSVVSAVSEDAEVALRVLGKFAGALGAAAAGESALENILNNQATWRDYVNLGVAAVGTALLFVNPEFLAFYGISQSVITGFNVGVAAWSIGNVGWDIYSIKSDQQKQPSPYIPLSPAPNNTIIP